MHLNFIHLLYTLLSIYTLFLDVHCQFPEFLSKSQNVAKKLNEDVVFECHVENLGSKVITWHREGKGSLSHDRAIFAGNVNIMGDDRMSTGDRGTHLVIKHLKESDAGRYYCQVNDAKKEIILRHYLKVLVPAKIYPDRKNNGNYVVKLNSSLEMQCFSFGVPQPNISWTRKGDDTILAIGGILVLSTVSFNSSGSYECTASNSIGPPAKTEIQLQVLYPPLVRVLKDTVYSSEGSHRVAELSCEILGEPLPKVYWIEPNNNIITEQKTQSHDFVMNGPENNVYTLIVKSKRDHKHFGRYKCVGENNLGYSEAEINFTGAPQRPVIISEPYSQTKFSYNLQWKVKSPLKLKNQKVNYWLKKGLIETNSTTLHINHQQLIKAIDITNKLSIMETDVTAYQMSIEDLLPDANYAVQIEAENEFGKSEYSEEFNFFTTGEGGLHPSVQAQSGLSSNALYCIQNFNLWTLLILQISSINSTF